MPTPHASVGSSKSVPSSGPAKSSGVSGVRLRKPVSSAAAPKRTFTPNASKNSVFMFYSEEASGIKVGPVPVLVMSLVFIVSVFLLHFWGKYTRSS